MGKSSSKPEGSKGPKKAEDKNKATLVACLKEKDQDNAGFLTKADTAEALKKLIPDVPDHNLMCLLGSFDKNDDDKLNIEEFSSFLSGLKNKKDELKKDDWLDTSKERISCDDLEAALVQTYQLDNAPNGTAKIILAFPDTDEAGEFDRKEFEKMWSSLLSW